MSVSCKQCPTEFGLQIARGFSRACIVLGANQSALWHCGVAVLCLQAMRPGVRVDFWFFVCWDMTTDVFMLLLLFGGRSLVSIFRRVAGNLVSSRVACLKQAAPPPQFCFAQAFSLPVSRAPDHIVSGIPNIILRRVVVISAFLPRANIGFSRGREWPLGSYNMRLLNDLSELCPRRLTLNLAAICWDKACTFFRVRGQIVCKFVWFSLTFVRFQAFSDSRCNKCCCSNVFRPFFLVAQCLAARNA